MGTPQPFKLAILNNPQQLCLELQGQLSDFIKKNGGAVGDLKPPQVPGMSAGEGSFLMTEQLALYKICRQGGAIYLDQRAFFPQARTVKAPVVLPQRITTELVGILKKYHPFWMSIHCTHPDELTEEMRDACNRLADAGIPLGSQTVLLAGINDSVETMRRLMHGLVKIRVKPYYLYQCDPILGSSHFRTPVSKGLEIYSGLRGHTTGYAVPNYVIDAPGGGGKIPLIPETVVGRDGNDLLIRNYEGKIFRYPDVIGAPPSNQTGNR